MRTYGKILTCLFVLFLIYSAGEARDRGVISGRVTWEGGYGFITGATIYLYDLSNAVIDSTHTNIKGVFRLTARAGQYYISAEKDNLVKEYFPDSYLLREARTIMVRLEQDVRVDFALDSGGWISGTFAFDGDGVQSGLITAIKIDQPHEGLYKSLVLNGPFPSAYALQGLLPGNYKILGRAHGKSTEYYPGVQDIGQADPVSVNKDVGISSIEFNLDQVGWGTIRGRIFNQANNEGIVNQTLYAYQWHDFWQDPNLMNTRTVSDGSYMLNIPAGEYFLFSIYSDISGNRIALYYNNCYDPTSANVIHISPGQTIQGIDFSIDYSITHNLSISGMVLNRATGYGLNDVIITAIDYETGQPAGSACSAGDGQFSVEDLAPGRYLLMFSGTYIIPYFYPQSDNWQDGEIIQLVDYFSDIRTDAITQDYGNNGLTIAGNVRSGSRMLNGARVYAYLVGETDPIAYARTDASGSYAIVSGLVPGFYYVSCDLFGYDEEINPYPFYLDLMTNPEELNIDFVLDEVATAIVDRHLPDGLISVTGNYPNPFNSATLIKLYSDRGEAVSSIISVYNILGQIVGDKNICVNPGINLIEWSANDFETAVSSGTYFYHFDGFGETYRMILLK